MSGQRPSSLDQAPLPHLVEGAAERGRHIHGILHATVATVMGLGWDPNAPCVWVSTHGDLDATMNAMRHRASSAAVTCCSSAPRPKGMRGSALLSTTTGKDLKRVWALSARTHFTATFNGEESTRSERLYIRPPPCHDTHAAGRKARRRW